MEVVNNENINESKNAKIDKADEVPKQTNAVLFRVLDCLNSAVSVYAMIIYVNYIDFYICCKGYSKPKKPYWLF